MTLLLSGRANVVSEYSNKFIHGVSKRFKLPKILRLNNKHIHIKKIKLSRHSLLARDQYECQYCEKKLSIKSLTIDHVVPKSKGGPTTWLNVVSACHSCNNKKGNKSLRETTMKLKRSPYEPIWKPGGQLKLTRNDPKDWKDWVS